MPKFHLTVFAWFLVAYRPDKGGMSLHDAVGVDCKIEQLLKFMEQVPSIWARACILDNCVRVTRLHGGRSWQ